MGSTNKKASPSPYVGLPDVNDVGVRGVWWPEGGQVVEVIARTDPRVEVTHSSPQTPDRHAGGAAAVPRPGITKGDEKDKRKGYGGRSGH